MPDALNYREDPRQGSPLSAGTGRATEKDRPKRPSERQLQEARKKTLMGPQLLRRRQSVSLHTGRHQGSGNPNSCITVTLKPPWGRATSKKRSCISAYSRVQLFASLWAVDCQASLSGRFSLSVPQYWSVLVNTGRRTLLEHYISCCLSHQLP